MFITFEGPDGSGKSTQIKRIAKLLESSGYDILLTREPGGTAIGDQIRRVLHDVQNVEMASSAEILLYSASRAQLVAQVIKPALLEGKLVLCDRYADSTMAYQGYGRGLSLEALEQITSFATGDLVPDITILFDIDAETGLDRRKDSGDEWNRMDQQELSFHHRTREGYLTLARRNPDRWLVINAKGDPDQVTERVWEKLEPRLPPLRPYAGK